MCLIFVVAHALSKIAKLINTPKIALRFKFFRFIFVKPPLLHNAF